MAGGPLYIWNHWAIQILVLLSLTLQVVLLLFAGIRRREASPVLRVFLWLAYQLADSTAIYAVGHLSLSGSPREHQLVAFWAPFLLLHLGGPDNITSYALEDNKLWLRHLVTLVVQVLGAGYVLYKHIAGSGNLILLAAVLMFVIGVVKYGERTWALKCSNMGSIRSYLKKEPRPKCHFYLEDRPPQGGFKGKVDEEEFLMRHAHSLFHICKRKRSSGSISPWDSPLLGRLARMLGLEEWWDIWHHSGTVEVSEDLKTRLLRHIDRLARTGEVSTQGIVRKKWGKVTLERCNLYEDLKSRLGVEFQEGVIIWHIATDVFLAEAEASRVEGLSKAEARRVKEIRMLSDYMMFLLVERPYMLPGLAQTRLYQRTCENLVDIWCEDDKSRAPSSNNNNNTLLKNLFRLHDYPNSRSSLRDRKMLAAILLEKELEPTHETPRLYYATKVAKILIKNDKDREQQKYYSLKVLHRVWMDFLVHAANRCSRESHAKKLSSGGELITVVWLLTEHHHQLSVSRRKREEGKP